MTSVKAKVTSIVDKCYVEVIIIAYLLFKLLINRSLLINGYVSLWYAIDYSYGFGSRLLIGSILRKLSPDGFVEGDTAYAFVVIALIVLCVIVGLLLGKIYRKVRAYNSDASLAAAVLIILYLASPASPEYLWTDPNMGRLDTYLLINTLLLVFISFKVSNKYIRYALFVIIALVSILIHQVYFFLFFPSLLVIMICDLWKEGIGKKDKSYIVIPIVSAFIVFGMFCYMQFNSGIYYDDLDKLYNDLSSSTTVYIDKAPLQAEYFWSIKDHFIINMLPDTKERLRFTPLTIIMLAPMWLIYTRIWNMVVKSCEDKVLKWKYILIRLTNIAYIPVFILMNDYGRWFGALFTVMMLNMLVLLFNEDDKVVVAVTKCGAFFKRYPVLPLAIIMYVACLDKFQSLAWIQQVKDFFYSSYDLLAFLFR